MSIKDQDMSEICFETCWPRARSNIPGRPRSHTERVVEGGQCLQKVAGHVKKTRVVKSFRNCRRHLWMRQTQMKRAR